MHGSKQAGAAAAAHRRTLTSDWRLPEMLQGGAKRNTSGPLWERKAKHTPF